VPRGDRPGQSSRADLEEGILKKRVLWSAALVAAFACRPRAAPPAADPRTSLSPGAAVLFVGAHADDEALMAGALLARLSRSGHPVYVLMLTRGEGTGIRGHEADEEVARVRAREFCLACTLYGARDCFAAAFPSRAHLDPVGKGFVESGSDVLRTWRRLRPPGPAAVVEDWIRRVRPEWLITLDPDHGMYGHPEHEAAARAAILAARRAGRFAPKKIFAAENRFFSLTPGNLDPGPIALAVPGEAPCGNGRTCWQVETEAAATYASQSLPDLARVPPEERFTFLREIPGATTGR
jgi:LmbE family N-acetylglucosaminyl deacetylase